MTIGAAMLTCVLDTAPNPAASVDAPITCRLHFVALLRRATDQRR